MANGAALAPSLMETLFGAASRSQARRSDRGCAVLSFALGTETGCWDVLEYVACSDHDQSKMLPLRRPRVAGRLTRIRDQGVLQPWEQSTRKNHPWGILFALFSSDACLATAMLSLAASSGENQWLACSRGSASVLIYMCVLQRRI